MWTPSHYLVECVPQSYETQGAHLSGQRQGCLWPWLWLLSNEMATPYNLMNAANKDKINYIFFIINVYIDQN